MGTSQKKHEAAEPAASPSRWPHRLAWVLACAVFPLVWIGGFVTSYDAGMAVPDWPTTFGHWFYPLQKWLWGINDLFLEHGHRSVAQVVGLLTIALAVLVWRLDGRKWMFRLTLVAVLGVVFQGTLGGLRVLCRGWEASIGNWEQALAAVHGCTAPLFFALCAAMVAFTSSRWRTDNRESHPAARSTQCTALSTTAGIYLLIVIGSQMRHSPPNAPHGWFVFWVWLKVILAVVVAGTIVFLLVHIARRASDRPMLVHRARWLVVLIFVQLLLGIGTWVTNYGIPAWFRDYVWAVSYTIKAEGPLQAWTTTAHAAVGSLTLVASLSLTLWSYRLLSSETPS